MPQPPPKPFSGIFVSYRRDDSSGHAGRLFDKLVSHFGKDRIFMDIDTIEPGEDFVTVIENAVGSCEILIAIIGRNWLSGTDGTTGRLDNPNDFVRVEIATALRRDIRVIPVLVQRASMPKAQELPDELAKLSRRNAVELTDLRWQTDVDQLISVMDRVLAKREERSKTARKEEEARRQQKDETSKLEEAGRYAAESPREAEAAQQEQEKQRHEEQAEGRSRQALARQAAGSAEAEATNLEAPRASQRRKSRHLYVALGGLVLAALLGGLYALRYIDRGREEPKADAAQNPMGAASPAPTSAPSIESRSTTETDKPRPNTNNSSSGNADTANKGNIKVEKSSETTKAKGQLSTGEAERQRQAIRKLDEAARQQRAINALKNEKPVTNPTPK